MSLFSFILEMFGEEETRNAGVGLEGQVVCFTVGEETLTPNIQKVG